MVQKNREVINGDGWEVCVKGAKGRVEMSRREIRVDFNIGIDTNNERHWNEMRQNPRTLLC
jgi:hypothetical protein